MIITKIRPPNKDYPIKQYRDTYFCYPKTKEDELELLLVYNGNNIDGDLKIPFNFIDEIPHNLVVNGHIRVSNNPSFNMNDFERELRKKNVQHKGVW